MKVVKGINPKDCPHTRTEKRDHWVTRVYPPGVLGSKRASYTFCCICGLILEWKHEPQFEE